MDSHHNQHNMQVSFKRILREWAFNSNHKLSSCWYTLGITLVSYGPESRSNRFACGDIIIIEEKY